MQIYNQSTSNTTSFYSFKLNRGLSEHLQKIEKIIAIALIVFTSIVAIYYFFTHFVTKRLDTPDQKETVPENSVKSKIAELKKTIFPEWKFPKNHSAAAGPPGFENYGFSCWVGSAMQVLCACKQFEGITRAPLKLEKFYKNKKECQETEKDLQKRVEVQNQLIDLFEVRKRGDPEHLKNALKKLHIKISKNMGGIQPPPSFDDPILFFQAMQKCFHYGNLVWIFGWHADSLFTQHKILDEVIDERKTIYPHAPQIIITRGHRLNQLNVNETIDLTKHFDKGNYRVVGIIRQPPGHCISYVRYHDQWFRCDDGKVNEIKLESIDLGIMDIAVLEPCEE